MWSAVKSRKCCATCANWGGQRQVHHSSVETPHPDTRGKCFAGVFCSVTAGPSACNGGSCPKYQPWGAL